MTILGTVTLSEHLILGGLETAPLVASSVRRTLGGRAVVQSVVLSVPGRELTLTGTNWFSQADLSAIQDLARLNQPVTLTHHRGTFRVLVTRIEAEPAVPYSDPSGDDWYSATIHMLEV